MPDEYLAEWEAGWRIDCDRPLPHTPTPAGSAS